MKNQIKGLRDKNIMPEGMKSKTVGEKTGVFFQSDMSSYKNFKIAVMKWGTDDSREEVLCKLMKLYEKEGSKLFF